MTASEASLVWTDPTFPPMQETAVTAGLVIIENKLEKPVGMCRHVL